MIVRSVDSRHTHVILMRYHVTILGFYCITIKIYCENDLLWYFYDAEIELNKEIKSNQIHLNVEYRKIDVTCISIISNKQKHKCYLFYINPISHFLVIH